MRGMKGTHRGKGNEGDEGYSQGKGGNEGEGGYSQGKGE